MIWKAINQSPEGYEPVYSVVEIDTGRLIADNLEKDEALKIERIHILTENLFECRDMLERLFIDTRCKDEDFLSVSC